MVCFFFYDKLTDPELINLINKEYEFCSGFIRVNNYDKKTNSLSIDDNSENNTTILLGKIIIFNMTTEDVLLHLFSLKTPIFLNVYLSLCKNKVINE